MASASSLITTGSDASTSPLQRPARSRAPGPAQTLKPDRYPLRRGRSPSQSTPTRSGSQEPVDDQQAGQERECPYGESVRWSRTALSNPKGDAAGEDRQSATVCSHAVPPTPSPAGGRLVWEQANVHAWFHYASREHVEQIAHERIYHVSHRGHQRHGTGLFVTNLAPGAVSQDDTLTLLFARQRDESAVEGVVVLARTTSVLPAVRFSRSQWMVAAPGGTSIDLTLVFIGWGSRSRASGEWTFSRGCFVPI